MNQGRLLLIILYIFLLPLCISLLNCFIFSHTPDTSLPPFFYSPLIDNFSEIVPTNDQDTEFKSVLAENAHFAFINYYENCVDHDEFRPVSKTCLDNYGFSVTLFESLETLYILNMSDDYQKAKNYILNFTFENRAFINVHEFWSRCIASLISIYRFSGDKSYIIKASQLADQVLYRKKGDFLNVKLGKTSNIFTGKFFLSNWLSGIPELIILNHLIQKPLYIDFIKEVMSKNPSSFIYPTRVTKILKVETIYNYFTTSFIKNAKLTEDLLSLISKKNNKDLTYGNNTNYDFSTKSKRLFKHFEITKKTKLSELTLASQILSFLKFPSELLDNIENEDRFGDESYMFGFQFKGDELYDLSKGKKYDIVKKVILNALQKHRTKNGFCGTTTSSIGKKYPDDIQHTELLGEWIKIGAMIACGYKFLFKSGIFNEYSHLLEVL